MALFPPALRTNLTGYWRVDGISVPDGSNVQTWYDNSGLRNDLAGNVGGGATYKVNVINGRPALLFDGVTTAFISGTTFSKILPNNLTGTVLSVFKATSVATNNANAFDNDSIWAENTGANTGGGAVLKSTGSAVSVFNDGAVTGSSEPYTIGNWGIHIWLHNGVNIFSGINDENSLTGAASGGTGALTPINAQFQVGMSANNTRRFTGYIAEILAWSNVLSTASLAMGLNYLRAKYFSANSPIQTRLTRADALEQSRDVASRRLWDSRRPYAKTSILVPISALDVELFTDVAVSTPLGLDPSAAGGGWGNALWARRLMRNYGTTIDLDKLDGVTLDLVDMRQRTHTYQSSERATRATSPERQGIMASAPGAVRVFLRPSVAYIVDPSSKAVVQINSGDEKVADGGLLLEHAASNYLLRSSFVSTSSGLTGPTAQTGASAATVGTTSCPAGNLFDTSITSNVFKITGPNPSTSADYFVTWPATIDISGLLSNVPNNFILGIDHVDTTSGSAATALTYTLQRANDGHYWNSAGRSWATTSATPTYNTITLSTGTMAWSRYTESIPTSSGTTTLTLAVGVKKGGTAAQTSYLAHVELAGMPDASSSGGLSGLNTTCPTSRIVNDASRTTRWFDSLTLLDASTGGYGIAPAAVGVFRFLYKPLYASNDGTSSILWTTPLNSGPFSSLTLSNSSGSFSLTYSTTSGGAGSGGTISLPVTTVAGNTYAISARWIGPSQELGLAAGTYDLFVVTSSGGQSKASTSGAIPSGYTVVGTPLGFGDYQNTTLQHLTPQGQIASVEGIPLALTDQEIYAWWP